MNDRRNSVEPWWDPNDPLEEGFRILARIILRKIMAQRAVAAQEALTKSETVSGEGVNPLYGERALNGEIS